MPTARSSAGRARRTRAPRAARGTRPPRAASAPGRPARPRGGCGRGGSAACGRPSPRRPRRDGPAKLAGSSRTSRGLDDRQRPPGRGEEEVAASGRSRAGGRHPRARKIASGSRSSSQAAGHRPANLGQGACVVPADLHQGEDRLRSRRSSPARGARSRSAKQLVVVREDAVVHADDRAVADRVVVGLDVGMSFVKSRTWRRSPASSPARRSRPAARSRRRGAS